ncbi:MAG: hypothetical protein GY949_03330 [Gammaproteobacteria bacterium]|nr:hypothetical protein [Gammaproteobacteria bacterium]
MRKAVLTVFAVIGTLFSLAGLADDKATSPVDNNALPATNLSLPPLYSNVDGASRWREAYPLDTTHNSNDWTPPFVSVPFQDSGTLARVSKLRSLSLLTFAEIGQSRLFFGVNDEGVVGLHFRAFRRQDNERHLEVARMPYLEKVLPETD